MAAFLGNIEFEIETAKAKAQDAVSRAAEATIEAIATNPLIYLGWLVILCVVEGQDLVERVPRMIERVIPVLKESSDPFLADQARSLASFPTHLFMVLLVCLCMLASDKFRGLRYSSNLSPFATALAVLGSSLPVALLWGPVAGLLGLLNA